MAFAGNSLYHATKWGIEGSGELVAQEVAPFGIGMTIVEPGGARTEFLYGSAAGRRPQCPSYDDNPAHAFLKMLDPEERPSQPAIPPRWPHVSIESVDVEPAPLRVLLLGSQALESTIATPFASGLLASRRRPSFLAVHGLPAWGVNGRP